MKKGYDKTYYDERDVLIPYVAETIKNLMIENNLKYALDVGCGTGRLVKYLNDKGNKAYGCDFSAIAVKSAKKINKKGRIIQASAQKLPFKNHSFDIITIISVIEHLGPSHVDKFLNESYRVLKPKGIIFMITPNFQAPLRFIQGKSWFAYRDPTHINFFTAGSLANLLKKHKFINCTILFKLGYHASLDWELPPLFGKLPNGIKKIIIFFLFSTYLTLIRNSFWMLAYKYKDE